MGRAFFRAFRIHEAMHDSVGLQVAERASERMALAARTPRAAETRASGGPMTMVEVRAAGYVVFEDGVYDITRFAARHPGGAFLLSMRGQDLTFAFDNAHARSRVAQRALRAAWVAPFAEASRDPLERDALALRRALRAEGFFSYGRRRLAFDVLRWSMGLAFAAVAFPHGHAVAFLLLLATTVDVVWWIHDAGHDAVFEDERRARRIIEWLGVAFLGMPQQGYHYGVHRVHHGTTNVVGMDQALETGPLAWDAATAATKPALFRRARWVQWFLVIVPAAGPALLVSALSHCVRRRQWGLLGAIAARWIAVGGLCAYLHAPTLLIVPWVAGSILGFMAGLNHFHMPLSRELGPSYVRAVFERTQNIENAGRFWHWLSGGLDLHVEHHLFPTMASHRYREVAPRVRALAAAHGLPYHATSRLGAIRKLLRALRSPPPVLAAAAESSAPAGCPFHRRAS